MSAQDLTPEALGLPATETLSDTGGRSQFISRTYMHLLGAVLLFAGIEYALFQVPQIEGYAVLMLSNWMAVLGAFILVSWIASHAAHRVESLAGQYAALGIFVLAEAIIFLPMFFLALAIDPGILTMAVAITLGAFLALTGVAMYSGRDFTFLRSFLVWAGLIALATIGLGLAIGFHLGTYFSMAMIGLAGASILYDTSKILKVYPEDRYVAAALELFASIALMLWYVLRLLLSRR